MEGSVKPEHSKENVAMKITLSAKAITVSALLAASLLGCHHNAHQGHRCKMGCPHHGCPAQKGVTNADYVEPRGQSPDDESFAADAIETTERQPRRGSEEEGTGGVARVRSAANAAGRATPGRLSQSAGGSPAPQASAAFTPAEARVPLNQQSAYRGANGGARFAPASFSPAEPRQSVQDNGNAFQDPDTSWMTGSEAQRYPDEYLLDGGDRAHPVTYDRTFRRGLDTEDTIGECVDHSGKRRTIPSNSVAIYAPRFGEVRSITTPGGQTAIDKLAGASELRRDSGVRTKVGPQKYAKNEGLKGIQTRLRASGTSSKTAAMGTRQSVRLTEHKFALKGKQEFSFAFRGEIDTSAEAYLAKGIDAAMHWSKPENLVAIVRNDALQEVKVRASGAELVGLEDRHTQAGDLHLVKLADKAVAQPGDVITFVIRFDNLGDLELNNVRIVDNLTPRLEFLEDSATCDLPGQVVMEDNDEGSYVLTFALDEPLPGRKAKDDVKNKGKDIRTGGVITFQCKVR